MNFKCYICEQFHPEEDLKRIKEAGCTRYLCEKCDQKRCKRCGCLLNNKFELEDWGHYTKKSLPYCKICSEEPFTESNGENFIKEIPKKKTSKEYYRENRERINAYQRKWYRENKEHVIKYREKNKDKILMYSARYRKKKKLLAKE
jgi:hypothetical protein